MDYMWVIYFCQGKYHPHTIQVYDIYLVFQKKISLRLKVKKVAILIAEPIKSSCVATIVAPVEYTNPTQLGFIFPKLAKADFVSCGATV
jgi:hypothetical protein